MNDGSWFRTGKLISRRFIVPALVLWAVLERPGGANGQTVSQGKTPAQIRFTYENPSLDPQRYFVTVNETGSGRYRSEPRPHSLDPSASNSAEIPSKVQDTELVVSAATRDFLFATARSRRFFSIPCDDRKGKVAFQGTKVLAYQGSDGAGNCSYNWSKDQGIEKITRIFQGISATLEAGARLATEHRHDLLALDHELDALANDLKEGRAAEVGNIAGELQSIAQDETVMQRARSRAAMLLRGAGPAVTELPGAGPAVN